MMDLYFKLIFSLFFVLAILGLFYFVVKKRINLNNTHGLFHILEYKSFGPKSGIMALKFCDRVFLLAITPTNINMIEQFDAKSILKDEQKKDEILEKIKKLKDSLDESD